MQKQLKNHFGKKVKFIFFQLLLFSLLSVLYNCHPIKHEPISTIVIITKDASESKDYSFPFTAMRVRNEGNIVYVDTSLNVLHYKLRALPYDTITIYSNHDNFEIRHDYSATGRVYYLLKRGDTLLLSYPEKNKLYLPYAKILNRSYNENELNYDYLFAKQVSQPDTLSISDAFSYYSLISRFDSQYIPLRETAKGQYQNLLNEGLVYLDSLQKNQLISEKQYEYRKNSILSIIFINNLDSIPISSLFPSDSLFLKYDSLIYYDFYRNLIDNHIHSTYPQGGIIKYAQIGCDEIIHSSNYSNLIKKYVIRLLAKELRDQASNDDLEKLLVNYRTFTGDSITYNDLKNQFGLLKSDSLEISLKDMNGKSITFHQLMEKYKGRYVYVDFWATWCIPCRALLPDNMKLEKEYHNKNIVFVSLAFNDDEKRWLSSLAEKPELFGNENYFITNTKSSRIIEKWGINSIPRYILYDEKGEIVLLDAPRPNTKEIRAVFNKLLK